MKLAFYKAYQPNATWLDKVVAFCTRGTKSHVEGVFSDGVWFSISPRDKEGARFKIIEAKEGCWTFIQLNLDIYAEERLRDKCLQKIGTKYWHIGAILSATPLSIKHSKKEFCSMMWANLLAEEGYPIINGCKYSPEELYDTLI